MQREFRNQAIQSAKLYYDYLSSRGKGVSETGVDAIYYENREYVLLLSGKLVFPDDVFFKIKGQIYRSGQIGIVEYDASHKTLRVVWNSEGTSPFTNCPPAQIKVLSDLKFLVESVGEWYQKNFSFGYPKLPPSAPAKLPKLRDKPTLEQEEALKGVLSSPLCYIWGAPGTGKTQFVLARAVLSYYLSGKRVIIIAPTNNAVEQTLNGVISVLKDAGCSLDKILRLGTPSSEFYSKYPSICEQTSQKSEIDKYKADLRYYSSVVQFYRLSKWINQIEAAESELQSIAAVEEQRISSALSEINHIETLESLEKARLSSLLTEINRLLAKKEPILFYITKKRSPLASIILGKKLSEQEAELNRIDNRLQELSRTHEESNQQLSDFARQKSDLKNLINEANKSISEAEEKVSSIPKFLDGLNAGTAKLLVRNFKFRDGSISEDDAKNAEADLTQAIESLEKNSDKKKFESMLVIAATADRFIRSYSSFYDYKPDHIFLDEAAYCPLIKAVPLLSLGRPLTLLGDHVQLPPVCEIDDSELQSSQYSSIVLWAQSSVHIGAIASQSIEEMQLSYLEHKSPDCSLLSIFMLLYTHRFSDNLAHVLASSGLYPLEFQGNIAFETEIYYKHVPFIPSKIKNTNVGEAKAIKDYAESNQGEDFIVLTPYRAQRDLLKKQIGSENVLTVHGSQGREWDTVILSIVVTTSNWFLNDFRLLNTAVSRARKRLILVCDCDYWKEREQHIIGRLLSIAEEWK